MAKQTKNDAKNSEITEKASERNQERAKEIFENYPGVNAVYFTNDDTAFLTENDAKNHAKTLDEKTVTVVKRQ